MPFGANQRRPAGAANRVIYNCHSVLVLLLTECAWPHVQQFSYLEVIIAAQSLRAQGLSGGEFHHRAAGGEDHENHEHELSNCPMHRNIPEGTIQFTEKQFSEFYENL